MSDDERAKFEAWISAPPYEMDIERTKAGRYIHAHVQLACEAWLERAKG